MKRLENELSTKSVLKNYYILILTDCKHKMSIWNYNLKIRSYLKYFTSIKAITG
jgi:hypothetical protein